MAATMRGSTRSALVVFRAAEAARLGAGFARRAFVFGFLVLTELAVLARLFVLGFFFFGFGTVRRLSDRGRTAEHAQSAVGSVFGVAALPRGVVAASTPPTAATSRYESKISSDAESATADGTPTRP